MKILERSIFIVLIATQVFWAQEKRVQKFKFKKDLTSVKRQSKDNYMNINKKPIIISLKPHRPFQSILDEWEQTIKGNKLYIKLIKKNIENRINILLKKHNLLDKSKILQLKENIMSKNFIKNDIFIINTLISISNIENDYLKANLINREELIESNSIKKEYKQVLIKNNVNKINDIEDEHDGKIISVNGRLFEKNGMSWYKEGAFPGSSIAWYTDICVVNTGKEVTEYFLKMDKANIPKYWDLFWLDDNGSKTYQSKTFELYPNYQICMNDNGPLQSYTQSPNNLDQGNVQTYYDLYWDRNWPIPNQWLYTKRVYLNNDVSAPNSSVNQLPTSSSTTTFTISWSGIDPYNGSSGIKYFDVQYKINSNGSWLPLYSGNNTSITMTLSRGNTYYFQCRATDNVLHVEEYPNGNGDTHTYILNKYVISVSANPSNGGAVSGSGNYFEGNNCCVDASSNAHWTFLNWTENGSVISNSKQYCFTVNNNRNLVANFALNKYTISISSNPANGGSTSGAGNYDYGTSCTISANPNQNFKFMNWTENNVNISNNSTFTFTVTKNRTIVANFLQKPNAPSDLKADLIKKLNLIKLTWTDNSDNENGFNLEREVNGKWETVDANIKANSKEYNDNNLQSNYPQNYRICSFNDAGSSNWIYANTIVSVPSSSVLPKKYFLNQNYPNPFNPSTIISFALPEDSEVKLLIYNSAGSLVKKLISGKNLAAGFYQLIFNGKNLSSGIYYYELVSYSQISKKSYKKVRKMILLK